MSLARLRVMLQRAQQPWKYATMQKNSVMHKNGFGKIPLGRDDDGNVWRLHYTPLASRSENYYQNPHSHGWGFTSFILRGGIQNTVYQPQETYDSVKGDNHHVSSILGLAHRRWNSGGADKTETYRPCQMDLWPRANVLPTCHLRLPPMLSKQLDWEEWQYELPRRLKVVSQKTLTAGTYYDLDGKTLHTTQVVQNGTLTAIVYNPQYLSTPEIYIRHDKLPQEPTEVHHPPLQPETVETVFNLARTLLSP